MPLLIHFWFISNRYLCLSLITNLHVIKIFIPIALNWRIWRLIKARTMPWGGNSTQRAAFGNPWTRCLWGRESLSAGPPSRRGRGQRNYSGGELKRRLSLYMMTLSSKIGSFWDPEQWLGPSLMAPGLSYLLLADVGCSFMGVCKAGQLLNS